MASTATCSIRRPWDWWPPPTESSSISSTAHRWNQLPAPAPPPTHRREATRGKTYLVPTRQHRQVLLLPGWPLLADRVPLFGRAGGRHRSGHPAARARPCHRPVPELQRAPAQRHVLALPRTVRRPAAGGAGTSADMLATALRAQKHAVPRKLFPQSCQSRGLAHHFGRSRRHQPVQVAAARLHRRAIRRAGRAFGLRRFG